MELKIFRELMMALHGTALVSKLRYPLTEKQTESSNQKLQDFKETM